MKCHKQTNFTVSRYDAEMTLESQCQTVGLVWKQFGLTSNWIAIVPYEKDAMSMSGLKLEQMELKVWENIKPSYLQCRYENWDP